jgi:hypothetical protein
LIVTGRRTKQSQSEHPHPTGFVSLNKCADERGEGLSSFLGDEYREASRIDDPRGSIGQAKRVSMVLSQT